MKNVFLFTLVILMVSCNNSAINSKIETIKAEPTGDQSLFFSEFVKDIELIPLDNKNEAFLSDSPELIVYNSEYYIYNRRFTMEGACPSENRLLKFDSIGKLIVYIGDHGRGPKEYLLVKNFCISEDTIYIFSSPDFVINKFKLNGEFIEKKSIPYKSFMQAFKYGDEYLLYLNQRNGVRDERLVIIDEKGKEISAFLPLKTKVSPYSENNCLSLNSNNEVLIREFYNDTVYSYNNEKGVVARFVVDFAEKSIPIKEYLKSEEVKGSFGKLFKQPFACLNKYFESEKYFLIEIVDHVGAGKYKYLYAIKNKVSGLIRWFDFEQENSFLKTSFYFLEGDKLYCLVSPTHFDTMTDKFKALIKNPELLDKITPEDNQVLLIISLK